MRFFYDYELKNGVKGGGHNLEKIGFYGYYIELFGVDNLHTVDGPVSFSWSSALDTRNLKYLKITPILERKFYE